MADDVKMEPVADIPPKVNPLLKPVVGTVNEAEPKTMATVTPPKPNPTASALRPGLKLPPKPGATVNALRPGIKLPPKPGATISALKPGLKLPPKPGATLSMAKPGATVTGLKPGLKLPPKPGATLGLAKPVIRKPGSTVNATKPLPKPILPKPPVASPKVEAAIEKVAAENKAAEVEKVVEPAAPVVEMKPVEPVAELKPVESVAELKPVEVTQPAPETPKMTPMDQLKSVTQKLKGVTQAIPQQAILRKTGIVADGSVSEVEKEAAKHKTARISLSDAIGAAPVKNENSPMKTIRIKRPIDIPGSAKSTVSAEKPVEPTKSADAGTETAATVAPTTIKTSPTASMTQRKTLKITRPGGAVRPAGKFGVKHPNSVDSTVIKTAATEGSVADGQVPEIADISDIPAMPAMTNASAGAAKAADTTPAWLYALSSVVQVAACLVMGALAWYLYQNSQTLYF